MTSILSGSTARDAFVYGRVGGRLDLPLSNFLEDVFDYSQLESGLWLWLARETQYASAAFVEEALNGLYIHDAIKRLRGKGHSRAAKYAEFATGVLEGDFHLRLPVNDGGESADIFQDLLICDSDFMSDSKNSSFLMALSLTKHEEWLSIRQQGSAKLYLGIRDFDLATLATANLLNQLPHHVKPVLEKNEVGSLVHRLQSWRLDVEDYETASRFNEAMTDCIRRYEQVDGAPLGPYMKEALEFNQDRNFPKFKVAKWFLNTPISKLKLSVGTYSKLEHLGFQTLKELLGRKGANLESEIGRTSLQELFKLFDELGIDYDVVASRLSSTESREKKLDEPTATAEG